MSNTRIERLKTVAKRHRRPLLVAAAVAVLGFALILRSLAATNPNLKGDLNSDNKVTVADLSILLSNFNKTGNTADLNGDNKVTVADLSIMLTNFGKSYTPTTPPSTPPTTPPTPPVSTETPTFQETTLLQGLSNPWDLGFLPTGEILFTQRGGTFSVLKNGQKTTITGIDDVKAGGEGGLMGMAVDPQFSTNRYVYVCYNADAGDIRVVRWKLADNLASVQEKNAIVTGIPAYPTGWHAGCRTAFGPDGNLWIGTGDSANGGISQNPKSLGGKVLRVTRDGQAVAGNQGGTFDPRIFNYGHRNVQGIDFFPSAHNGVVGLTSEHGPDFDDEINLLVNGNFGWAPPAGGYDQSVSMNDTAQFPDTVLPIWKSGEPTQAPSGISIINDARWKGWNGAVAIAMLKATHLKILRLDAQNKIVKEEKVLSGTYGRLRSVHQGPDGNLYLTTDNGSGGDKIVKLTPQ